MTTRDHDRHLQFTRRSMLIAGAQLGLFAVLAGRLWQLQVLESPRYRTLADDNRIQLRLEAAPRGIIQDRLGIPMAGHQQTYRAVLDANQRHELESILAKISDVVPVNDTVRKRIQKDIRAGRFLGGVLLADNLNWEQVAQLELRVAEMPGLEVQTGDIRSYPYGAATAHVLGFVGPVSEPELEKEPWLAIPGLRLGKNGIESQLEKALRGTAGAEQLEVNAHHAVVRKLSENKAIPGETVTLTLDIGLQQYVQSRLAKEESGACVVLDVMTGAVRALASHPGFDPNLFMSGIRQEDWDSLMGDERAPLTNKAVSGQYAPGSAFKLVTALAGLEAGVINANTTVVCPGHYDLGRSRFHCWKAGGHGAMNVHSAIVQSCDTFFYETGRRLGVDRIAAQARRLGLGVRTGIDIPHERSGLIADQAWKKAKRNQEWHPGETLINAIGQGYMLTTPLQLAVMTARLVNGGKVILPYLTQKIGEETLQHPEAAIAAPGKAQNLEKIRVAMDAVVNGGGTASGSRITEKGFEFGGKTGTSQVRRITKAERATGVIKNENLPWKQRDHALFVGYAPVSNPRFAVAVIIEHGGSGGHTAAPIARDVLLEAQKRIPA